LAGLYRVAEAIPIARSLANKSSLSDSLTLKNNIIVENFGTALAELPLAAPNSNDIENELENKKPQTVYLRSRQRHFTSSTTLLLDAENAGIRLTYGCRQGICQLCRCNKVSGMVKNIRTGQLSSDGYESIQTCINTPVTDVVLDI
jgi:ferredoxin